MDIAYPIAGFVVGALAGLTGMGGGSIMTPLLILFFGIAPTSAVGTDLLFAAATKTAGANVHAARGDVEWRVVGRLAAGSVPAALFTVWLVKHHLPRTPALEHAIIATIGVMLLISAVSLLFNLSGSGFASKFAEKLPAGARPALTVLLGLVLGAIVSATSVGAGAVGIAVLRHLYPEMPAVRLVGSDIAHAVPLTLVAGTGHWLAGDVQPVLLGLLLLGSIPGICLASTFAHYMPDAALRRALGAVLFAVAARLLMI
jgi:uncharacterized protein